MLVKFLLLTLTHWEVRGRENIPKDGPLIVAANHLNLADPPLLSASIPRRITFLAKEELFSSIFSRSVMCVYGVLRVRRNLPDREAINQAQRVLDDGSVLGVFPEGTRSPDHRLQQGYHGASLIAMRSGAPILPVGISGSEGINGVMGVLRRPNIVVNIGKPFQPPHLNGRLSSARLRVVTDSIMEHIAELLPPGYRGVYGNERGD